jgi:hypothetical protein
MRELLERAFQIYSIGDAGDSQVRPSDLFRAKSLAAFIVRGVKRGLVQRLDAPPHQNNVEGETIEPGGKCRFRTKRVNLSKHLQEDILREVLRKPRIPRHSETESMTTAAM